jgi:adenylate cyclase, class 2
LSPDKPFFMSFINIEIKARTNNTEKIRQFLLQNSADFRGVDIQTDTYFTVPSGRLKLRQGNIENSLIFYQRQNIPGPKQSDFDLVPVENGELLRSLLTKALGVKIVVIKNREIYYIANVKFHLDTLDGIGQFVEIEASNKDSALSPEELREQCNFYVQQFSIKESDMLSDSYSDMIFKFENLKI